METPSTEKRSFKKVSDSYTEQAQVVMAGHINGAGRLFGGQLMSWIDVVAAVTARRHSGYHVTTAAVDHLEFRTAAYANDTLILKGRITWVGRTSMEVRVDSFVEALDGSMKLINRAYVVLVAIDDQERPVEVPGLELESQEDFAEWEAAKKRAERRSAARSPRASGNRRP